MKTLLLSFVEYKFIYKVMDFSFTNIIQNQLAYTWNSRIHIQIKVIINIYKSHNFYKKGLSVKNN